MNLSSWPGVMRRDESGTIRDALSAVDRGASSVALMVDSEGKFCGLVTDGDIRRALLSGLSLHDPVESIVKRDALVVGPSDSRSAVLDLMQAFHISVIPVVDHHGLLVNVHLLHELIGGRKRDNACVILAGGRGTRLGELTAQIPKPMVKVAGRPILERLILHMVGHGIRKFIISVGYLGTVIEDYFGDGEKFGCNISYVRDSPDHPLGTGGPLSLVGPFVSNEDLPLIVVNGDLVTQADITALLDLHQTHSPDVTIAVHKHQYEVPYGVIESEDGETVVQLIEKPKVHWLISAGLYVFSRSVISGLKPGAAFPLTDLIERCIVSNRKVRIWNIDSSWIDVGTPSELARARGEL